MDNNEKSEDLGLPVDITFDSAIERMFANKKLTDFARLRKQIKLNNVFVDDIEDEDDKILIQNVINNILENKIQDEIYSAEPVPISFFKRPFIKSRYAIDAQNLHPDTINKLHLIFANLLNKQLDK